MSGHKGPVTSVVLSNCGLKCFSASKDKSVIMWDLSTNKKTILRPSWSRKSNPVKQSCEGEVLALAIFSDDRFLVSGGRDKSELRASSRTERSQGCCEFPLLPARHL